jgi:hypothetical protein
LKTTKGRHAGGTTAALLAVLVLLGVSSSPANAAEAREAKAAADHSARVEALRERLPDAALTHSVALGDGFTRKVFKFGGAEARNQRASWRADADELRKIQTHVERQMRQGRAIGRDSVDIIAFEVPDVGAVYTVQSKRDRVEEVVVDVIEDSDSGEQAAGIGAVFTDIDSTPAAGGMGFDWGSGSGQALRKGYGERDIWFDPTYLQSGDDHHVVQRYEKWQNQASGQKQHWAYNSFGHFNAANPATWTGLKAELIDATLRARPYKGYESRVVAGPSHWNPKPSESCSTISADVSMGVGASVEFPLSYCSPEVEVYPDVTKHSFGAAWYGYTTSAKEIDMSFAFQASSGSVTPIFSDYVWMGVAICSVVQVLGHCWVVNRIATESWKWTDGGW